ncbi:MAG: UDP-2,3-diacylglucosamine diphosphatase [Candidatus Competibacteraceae bacterium]|nr:UDP-2,3-diacylglucosamine diphosphatase [Candidatus Competibacteraceae bacterium]
MPREKKYRSIFISDIHLGLSDWQADILSHFLKHNRAENVYLVGDIIDCWKLKRRWYWPQSHAHLVRRILKLSEKSNVVYIPGNHDEIVRQFLGISFGKIEIVNELIHVTADGKRLLVCHGDKFDSIVLHNRLLTHCGAVGYELLLKLNAVVSGIRRKLGCTSHWSLSSYVKSRVKSAVKYVTSFEDLLIDYARRNGADGVVCGHLHQPAIYRRNGLLYCNCGDFVESMSLLVEHHDGRMELLYFLDYAATETGDEQILEYVHQPSEDDHADLHTTYPKA